MDLFDGKTWLIYGRISLPKQEAIDAITSRGGRVVTSVSSKLDYLVWEGETLVPGEPVSAAKVSDLLKLGGLAVGDADFAKALNGEISDEIRGYLEARAAAPAPAPAPKPKAKKAAAPSALTPESLLARLNEPLSKVKRLERASVVERAIAVCVEKARPELGDAMAAAMPSPYREMAQVRLAIARGDGPAIEVLIPSILAAYQSTDPSDKDELAIQLLSLGIVASPLTPKASELEGLAMGALEHALKFGNHAPVAATLGALFRGGRRDEVRTLLARAYGPASRMFPELELRHGEMSVFADDPELATKLFGALGEHQRNLAVDHPSTAEAFSAWPIEALERLAQGLYEAVVTRLGAALIARGRTSDARRLFGQGEGLLLETRVERHHLLGEAEAVRELLSGEPPETGPWTTQRIVYGVETMAQALARLDSVRGPHVMNDVKERIALAKMAQDRGESDVLPAILASCESLLARPERTPHDRGLEAEIHGALDTLRVEQLTHSQASAETVRALLEAQLEALPALLQMSHDNEPDPGMRGYGKNAVAWSFVRRAGRAGFPDLAVKGTKKQSPRDRESGAVSVAGYFLPSDPGRALQTLDVIAGASAARQLTADGKPPFLVALWQAVLR